MTLQAATFRVGVLADHFGSRAAEAARIEKSWRVRHDEFEQGLPEPSARTTEQWEELVNLTGELYYAIAAASSTSAAARQIEKLVDALDEVTAR